MQTVYVRQAPDGSYVLGNAAFQMTVGLGADGRPAVQSLILASQERVDWAAPALPLGPKQA